MDYNKIYNNIIQKAYSEFRVKKCGVYYERHHITPKCIGGNNDKENLVLLTAREHFICHKLLTFIYPNNKSLFWAYYIMVFGSSKTHCGERNFRITSKEYGLLKIKNAKYFSEINKGANRDNYFTEDGLRRLSERFKGENNPMYGVRKYKTDNPFYGKKHSEETKVKISNRKYSKGINNHSYGRVDLIGENNGMYGKKHTQESIDKIKLSISKRPILICPYCSIQSKSIANMKRYHFENCKLKVA